jgi:hypothetical protein
LIVERAVQARTADAMGERSRLAPRFVEHAVERF